MFAAPSFVPFLPLMRGSARWGGAPPEQTPRSCPGGATLPPRCPGAELGVTRCCPGAEMWPPRRQGAAWWGRPGPTPRKVAAGPGPSWWCSAAGTGTDTDTDTDTDGSPRRITDRASSKSGGAQFSGELLSQAEPSSSLVMATYTCITCRVAFKDADIQRAHYKTDWHRYNLKRKVADMPPVTAENFQERVLAQRAVAEEQNKVTATYCTVCSKRFSTFNAYENHLKSKKHLELEKKAVQAVSKKVKILNEKNLEKGLALESVNKDEMNAAIQQAIRAQPSSSPKKTPLPPNNASSSPVSMESTSQLQSRERSEKPPRLQWFEQQAKKLAKQQAEEEEDTEEGWEDMDSDEDIGSDEEMESVGEEEEEQAEAESAPAVGAIPVTDCLFCSHHSRSLMKNVAHMTKVHSFFIPDIEYLVDLRGLIKYLGEKIGVGKICIWCNEKGKSFYSTEAVQAHMNDKSHCKLFTDGDAALEFADFYDFRSSYPDHKEGQDGEVSGELPAEKDLEYDDDTMELILPSGARVGHRSLMRYYKQRFGLSRTVAVAKNKKAVGRVLQQYKALGWTSQTGAVFAQQRDMQYLQRMKSKWMLKTGMSNNATKQRHFRPQVRF